MTELESLAERLRVYDPSLFLGYLAWYTIAENSRIDHSAFCKALLEANVQTQLPPALRGSDVFKRACTQSQRVKQPWPANVSCSFPEQGRANYRFREIAKDTENIWRRLVRELIDSAGKTLDYAELSELHYHRPSGLITVTPLSLNTDQVGEQIVQDVLHEFQQSNNTLTAQSIRILTMRTLDRHMLATKVRSSGGVYFVRQQYVEQLDALASVINGLPGGSTFHTLPLLDDSKQREMLRQAFEDESIGETDRLLDEMRGIISSGKKITRDKAAEFKVNYDLLRSKVVEYSDLLDTAMTETASRLEVMSKMLFELLGNIK